MRSLSLSVSLALVVFVIGGGLAVKVGAEESSFHQVVVFSEVLSLVLDNYVDPLEAEKLLRSAYEGMLAGLDARGAYLTPEELAEWKAGREDVSAGPGISVLQAGRALQVVAVDAGSPAEKAGVAVGDQIRSISGRLAREMSLDQAWRLIRGEPGSTVQLEVLHATDGYRRELLDLSRVAPRGRSYELRVERETGVLRILDPGRVPGEELAEELDDVRSRGVSRLLIDLRNVADLDPRAAGPAARLFADGPLLLLKDREGRLIESVRAEPVARAWTGSVSTLVNGATAGSAEALASLIQLDLGGRVLGEPTYGLGSEAKLYEMEDGSGLLVSAYVWETGAGARWNGGGVSPDEVIRGRGTDYEARQADQLERALEYLERQSPSTAPEREAA